MSFFDLHSFILGAYVTLMFACIIHMLLNSALNAAKMFYHTYHDLISERNKVLVEAAKQIRYKQRWRYFANCVCLAIGLFVITGGPVGLGAAVFATSVTYVLGVTVATHYTSKFWPEHQVSDFQLLAYWKHYIGAADRGETQEEYHFV